mgnify:CR=1 FL=1
MTKELEEESCKNCVKYVNDTSEEWCAKHCRRYPGMQTDCYERFIEKYEKKEKK